MLLIKGHCVISHKVLGAVLLVSHYVEQRCYATVCMTKKVKQSIGVSFLIKNKKHSKEILDTNLKCKINVRFQGKINPERCGTS